MNANKKTSGQRSDALIKAVIYIVLIVLAVTIIVPVAWVFMASVKQNSEFYGNPFTLPQGLYLQNFVDAWTKARMGEYFMTSVMKYSPKQAYTNSTYGYGMAIGVVVFTFSFALAAIVNKVTEREALEF